MLFSLEREGNPATRDDMNDLEDILLSDLSQSQKDRCCTIHLHGKEWLPSGLMSCPSCSLL